MPPMWCRPAARLLRGIRDLLLSRLPDEGQGTGRQTHVPAYPLALEYAEVDVSPHRHFPSAGPPRYIRDVPLAPSWARRSHDPDRGSRSVAGDLDPRWSGNDPCRDLGDSGPSYSLGAGGRMG